MHLIWRISLITFLTIFLTISLYGQYVNDQGEVNKSLILNELRAMTWGSPSQDLAIDQILLSLRQDTKSHPVLLTDEAKKGKVLLIIRNLAMRVGDFYFLNPDSKKPRKRYDQATDTLTSQIMALSSKWDRVLDSLSLMTAELKMIVKDENQSYQTKGRACHILVNLSKIDTTIIDFILSEIPHLSYVTPDIYMDDAYVESERSALRNLFVNYTGWTIGEDNHRNFAILPYMIKYWGNPDWEVQSAHDNYGNNLLFGIERASFAFLTQGYNKPWLLFEWILANAKDPKTPVLQTVGEAVERKKEHYYSNPENKGK